MARPPLLDVEAALRRVNGRGAVLKRLLRIFAEEFHDTGAGLRAHLAAREVGEAERLAHTLKSAAATLGMSDVAEQAREIEMALRQGDIARATPRLGSLETALAAAIEACATVEFDS